MKHGTSCPLPTGRGDSAIGRYYIERELPAPTPTTIVATHFSDNVDCTITSIVETAVT